MEQSHKFDLLVALYIFCIAVAELMGAKTFPLGHIGAFPLNASIAIFVVPLMFTITDTVTEVYGKERSRSLIRVGLIVIFLIFLFSVFATHLPPSLRFEARESAFDTVFRKSAHIALSSLVAFAVAQSIDVILFARLRERFGGKLLWLRNNLTTIFSQAIDTSVFLVLAFYLPSKSPAENAVFLASLAIPYWLLKCLFAAAETPFVYLGVRWLKSEQKEPAV